MVSVCILYWRRWTSSWCCLSWIILILSLNLWFCLSSHGVMIVLPILEINSTSSWSSLFRIIISIDLYFIIFLWKPAWQMHNIFRNSYGFKEQALPIEIALILTFFFIFGEIFLWSLSENRMSHQLITIRSLLWIHLNHYFKKVP